MRNSILVCCTILLSGCGIGYDSSAYVDPAEINNLLKLPYGSSIINKEATIKILAPKDYTLWVLKELAKKIITIWSWTGIADL